MRPKPRDLNPTQQLVALRRDDPVGAGKVYCDRLEWITTVRATPVARTYDILIAQKPQHEPRVRVLRPSLKTLAGERRIPHLYDQEQEVLCLYFPAAAEFDHRKFIGPQILPWAAMWFYYFEEWLVSDDWKGGGFHPPKRDLSNTAHRGNAFPRVRV